MMARLTQAQWRTLIDEQAASGQTAMAFCAERGINNKYFSTRKKQLLTQSGRLALISRQPLALPHRATISRQTPAGNSR